MRVVCRHGHFAFYPKNSTDVGRFTNYYDVELVRDGNFYTFPFLKDAPRYSLVLKPYLGLPATTTFEGRDASEVFRENGFVYNIELGIVVPKLSITTVISPPQAGYFFLGQSPLIQPGSRTITGQQVLSYDAEFIQEYFRLKVREYSDE